MRCLYSEEQKNKAIELYKQGVPVKDIAEQTGMENTAISKYAHAAGCEPRRQSSKRKKYKHCPNCRRTIELGGAKYCPYCATDLRSEKELLTEKTQRLFGMLQPLPSGDKDEARDIINEVIKYIKG